MNNKETTKKVMFEKIVKGIDGSADIAVYVPSEKRELIGFGANGLHGYSYVIYDENPTEIVIFNGVNELFKISKDSELLIMLNDLVSFVED